MQLTRSQEPGPNFLPRLAVGAVAIVAVVLLSWVAATGCTYAPPVAPTPTPTSTPAPIPAHTPTPTSVLLATPTPVATATPAPVPTGTPTPTLTAMPAHTPTPAATATPTPAAPPTPTSEMRCTLTVTANPGETAEFVCLPKPDADGKHAYNTEVWIDANPKSNRPCRLAPAPRCMKMAARRLAKRVRPSVVLRARCQT